MQLLEIGAIVILVVGLIVAVVSARASRPGSEDLPVTRLFIGCVLGVVGAVVFLAPEIDVIPDGFQAPFGPILIGGVTLLLLLGSVYRMAR
jgi:hypothetical protein